MNRCMICKHSHRGFADDLIVVCKQCVVISANLAVEGLQMRWSCVCKQWEAMV